MSGLRSGVPVVLDQQNVGWIVDVLKSPVLGATGFSHGLRYESGYRRENRGQRFGGGMPVGHHDNGFGLFHVTAA